MALSFKGLFHLMHSFRENHVSPEPKLDLLNIFHIVHKDLYFRRKANCDFIVRDGWLIQI